jgi:DME family drug/metabolite transporter
MRSVSSVDDRRPAVPRIQVLLAALCFGTTGTAQALGPDGASPLCVGAVRVALGAALLLLTVRLARSAAVRLARAPLAVGGLGVAGYQLCFFAAVHATGVAVGTVAALGSAPVFAGLGGWLVDRTRPGRAWAVATALAGVGVALMALGGSAVAKVSAPGVLLALGAGASYAVFTLASKRLLDAGAGVDRVMAGVFALGALVLVPVLVVGDLDWLASASGVAMALWLAAVPTALAYILFAHGLRLLPASEVTTLTLVEPVTAVSLGATVLGERPGALAVAGIAFVIAGLAVLTPLRPSWRLRAAG